MKNFLPFLLMCALLLSACGPEPEPTLSAAELQGTAMAAALTMIAETQAAMPTATPIPPTETPSPTPLPTNTIAPLLLPTASPLAQATASDICDDLKHLIPSDATGPKTTLKIVNEHNSTVTVSLYLNKTNFGECGYRSYTLPKNGSTVQTLPQGCYSAWAWSDSEKDRFNSHGYGLCANNTDKFTLVIRGEIIVLLPP